MVAHLEKKAKGWAIRHIFIRVLTALTAFDFLFFVFGSDGQSGHRSLLHRMTVRWTLISIVVFPLYILLERLFMRYSDMDVKPLLIDAGFVVLWIFLFFGVILFNMAHYAIL